MNGAEATPKMIAFKSRIFGLILTLIRSYEVKKQIYSSGLRLRSSRQRTGRQIYVLSFNVQDP
jgi:hypothetical protein